MTCQLSYMLHFMGWHDLSPLSAVIANFFSEGCLATHRASVTKTHTRKHHCACVHAHARRKFLGYTNFPDHSVEHMSVGGFGNWSGGLYH